MNQISSLQLKHLNGFLKPDFKDKPSYNYSLEGLRGLAAIFVAYAHVFGFKNALDPSYNAPKYLHLFHAAHGAVLIFFILSGYVIGLTSTKSFSYNRAFEYLFRRAVRLIPIYWISIIISVIFSPENKIENIVGNMFFLQNLFYPTISANEILWTLNYEIIYYLLFLFIWFVRPKAFNLLLTCFYMSVIGWFFPQMPQFFSYYASGWIFWLLGLWLVWKVKPKVSNKNKIPLASYILLLVATNHLNTGKVVLNGLGFANNVAGSVNLTDLFLLPICFLIFIEVTHRRFKGYKILIYLSLLLPLLNVVLLLSMGRLFETTYWILSAICLLLAIILWKFKISTNILAILAPFGRISYAFYLLHMPMMKLVHDYFPYEGTAISFCLRLIVWALITTGMSVLLELVMQPVIKKFFYQKFMTKKV